jgi:hypothetical protein
MRWSLFHNPGDAEDLDLSIFSLRNVHLAVSIAGLVSF